MKTATAREFRNQYRSILDLVEGGEEVAILRRGKIIARVIPEKVKLKRVDWSKSAALTMDKSKLTRLTAEQVESALADSQGRW